MYPGEDIRVVDRGLVDNGDVDGLFAGSAGDRPGRRQREFGFAGTALTGGEAAAENVMPTSTSFDVTLGTPLLVRWLLHQRTDA